MRRRECAPVPGASSRRLSFPRMATRLRKPSGLGYDPDLACEHLRAAEPRSRRADRPRRQLHPPPRPHAQSLRGTVPVHRVPAAVRQGGGDDSRPGRRPVSPEAFSGAERYPGHAARAAARRGLSNAKTAAHPRPRRAHHRRNGPLDGPGPPAGRRGADRAAHDGSRDRPMDGRDAADLPARPARRASARRSGRTEGLRENFQDPGPAEPGGDAAAGANGGGRTGVWRAGISRRALELEPT